MTTTLVLSFVASFFVSAVLTPAVRRFATERRLAMSAPRPRDIHAQPVPRLGGLAVVASVLLVTGGVLLAQPESLQFVPEKVLGVDRNLLGVLLGGMVLVAVGFVDDLRGLSPGIKFLFQAVAVSLVVAFGVKIHWIANPLGGVIELGQWSYLVVPLWLLAMINVMNWFDGLDGLSSGLSVIASVAIIFLALQPVVNQPATALLAAIVAGAALGFLPYNWHPARIFLGDSGSMFLGYMVGVFAIISGAKFATAALVLGIPIFDAIWVVGRRLLTGQPVWRADKLHLHHRFLAAGIHPRTTVLILYTIAAAFAMIALSTSTQGKVAALGTLVALMVLVGIALVLRARTRRTA